METRINPLVSVIFPMYKVEKYIARCAKSFLEQTYDNLELIFVNDGSPDNSEKILRETVDEYPARKSIVTIISHEVNKGLATARYTGFNHSKGKYIIHIDSDDYADPTYIEELVKKAEETGADIVVADYYKHIGNKTNYITAKPDFDPEDFAASIIMGKARGYLWNKLILRSLFTDNNINSIPKLDVREDKSVSFRLAYCAKKIEYLPKRLFHYNFNQGSITDTILTVVKKKSIKCQDDDIKLLVLMQQFADEHHFSKKMMDAVKEFKIQNYCFKALTGDIEHCKKNASYFDDLTIEDIKNSTTCVSMHKRAGILLLKKRYFTLSLLRIARQIKVASLRKIDQI